MGRVADARSRCIWPFSADYSAKSPGSSASIPPIRLGFWTTRGLVAFKVVWPDRPNG